VRGETFCRLCDAPLGELILGLGRQPLANALLKTKSDSKVDAWPLDFRICPNCSLGQIGEYVNPEEIFSSYTYFSSTSKSWLQHAEAYAIYAKKLLNLNDSDLVIEIASNDGYLLKFFNELGVRTLGIEPAENVARTAIAQGVETLIDFFGERVASQLINDGIIPKLVICNNVLAHVPDIQDFLKGLAVLIEAGSIVSIEAPTMSKLLENNLFDTIYHEHFSYLSTHAIGFAAKKFEISLFKVEVLETHGGSNRYWLGDANIGIESSVNESFLAESKFGLLDLDNHKMFESQSRTVIENFNDWLNSQKGNVVGFGAAAKATVILNAVGDSTSKIRAVIDSSPEKQGLIIPGVNIPIVTLEEGIGLEPEAIVIFAWNLATEIKQQVLAHFPPYQGTFLIAIPEVRII